MTDANEREAMDRRQDRFLSVLVHELRNPLAPIQNAIEVLKLSRPISERVDRCSELIDRQVGRMAQLLEDLVDVSRIQRGAFELRLGSADLRSVLEQALQRNQSLIAERGHTVVADLPPAGSFIPGDAPRLVQLFAGLIDNAAKFTDRGGTLTITHEFGPDQALVSVRDTGIGIDPAIQQLMFEPFALAASEHNRHGNGLGLGLPLARGIAQGHGGQLRAVSAGPGKGSDFRLTLPVPAARVNSREPAGLATNGRSERWRMVLADDRQLNADTLSELIRLQGHDVMTVYDGEAAVSAAEQMRPNAVVLDIGMPGMDGYEACRRIRSETWGREILIVALTGWGQRDVAELTREAGFSGHLLKPVDHLTLLTSLDQLRTAGLPAM